MATWNMKYNDTSKEIYGGGYTAVSGWTETGHTVVQGLKINIPDLFDADGTRLKKYTVVSSGTTTSTVANKCVDTGATFSTDAVVADDIAVNLTQNTATLVLAVDSETQLGIDEDIFASGDSYEIARIENI